MIRTILLTVVSFIISLVLSFFIYLYILMPLWSTNSFADFTLALGALFYIPAIAAALTIPVYLLLKKLFVGKM